MEASIQLFMGGRGGRDRTGDLLLPKQARYRCATPRRYNDDTVWSGS